MDKKYIMVRTVNFTLLILLIVTTLMSGLISCRNKKKDYQLLRIDFDNKYKRLDVDRFFSDVNFIALETRSDCLINEIKKISIYKDIIFILDEIGSQTRILVFRNDGSFLKEFGSRGKGPEEIYNPRDFIIKNGMVYIWDTGVHEFDIEGNYIRKVCDAYFGGNSFSFAEDGFLFFYGVNLKGNIGIKYEPETSIYKDIKVTGGYGPLTGPHEDDAIIKINENYYFFSPFCDTIFTLSGNLLKPYMQFVFHNEKSLNQLINENALLNPFELAGILNSTEYAAVNKYLENEQFIVIFYSQNQNSFVKIIDKGLQAVETIIIDNASLSSIFLNNPLKLDERGSIISAIYPHDFSKFKKYHIENTKLRELIESTDINSNPLLVWYSLK